LKTRQNDLNILQSEVPYGHVLVFDHAK